MMGLWFKSNILGLESKFSYLSALLSFALTRLGLRGSFTYSCKSSEDEIRVSRLLGRGLDTSEVRRRLDRLLELR